MNILMVFHAPPYPPDLGPSRRHYHELTALLERGHRVSVLSYGDEVDERQFRDRFGEQCAHVRFVPLHPSAIGKALTRCWCMARARSDFARFNTRRFQRALDAMIASADYDLISFSTTMLGSLRLPAGIPLVGDTHNVEFDNLRRAFRETRHPILREYFRVQAALTRREEVAFARRFDLVCATSERDRDVLLAAVPEARVEVIPNGIDLEAHRRRHVVRERGTILFTGLMSYYPNAHGALPARSLSADCGAHAARTRSGRWRGSAGGAAPAGRRPGDDHRLRSRRPSVLRARRRLGPSAAQRRRHARQGAAGDGDGGSDRLHAARL
jgi:glycosyltransferase involved in cell wall biosynthesis